MGTIISNKLVLKELTDVLYSNVLEVRANRMDYFQFHNLISCSSVAVQSLCYQSRVCLHHAVHDLSSPKIETIVEMLNTTNHYKSKMYTVFDFIPPLKRTYKFF